jgi:hypothetical protein
MTSSVPATQSIDRSLTARKEVAFTLVFVIVAERLGEIHRIIQVKIPQGVPDPLHL